MPLPKLQKPDENMINTVNSTMGAWDGFLANETAQAAIGLLSDTEPQNQKLQNLCTTYFHVCNALKNMSTTKVGQTWAENFNIVTKGMAELAGYDESGNLNPENSLLSVANSAFGKKGFTSAFHLNSLVTLANSCSTNTMRLHTLDNQLHVMQAEYALNREEDQTKKLGDTSYEFFKQLNEEGNKFIKEALSNDNNLNASYDKIDATVKSMEQQISKNSDLSNAGSFQKGVERMQENNTLKGNIEKAKQWKQAINNMAEKRNTLYDSNQKLSTTQKHADNHLNAAQNGINSNTFVTQLKDILEKNLTQIDQGKRLFHRDSKEFTSMKTSLQNVHTYLKESGGKPDFKKLSNLLQTMQDSAETYEKTKLRSGKEYGKGTTMRDMRLGMAQTLKNVASSAMLTSQNVELLANKMPSLTERANKVKAAREPLDTSTKEAFMQTGSSYAEQRLQREQAAQQKKKENPQPTVQKTDPSVQKTGSSVRKKASPLAMIHSKGGDALQ